MTRAFCAFRSPTTRSASRAPVITGSRLNALAMLSARRISRERSASNATGIVRAKAGALLVRPLSAVASVPSMSDVPPVSALAEVPGVGRVVRQPAQAQHELEQEDGATEGQGEDEERQHPGGRGPSAAARAGSVVARPQPRGDELVAGEGPRVGIAGQGVAKIALVVRNA